MSLAVLQASVLDTGGGVSVAPSAQITVRTPAGVLATLCTDRAGTTPTGANPIFADSKGFFRVYVAPGRYKVTVITAAGAQVYEDVILEADAEAKRNIAATDPAVTNDETQGYSAWSLWANSATSEVFRCIDATEGAAVWVKTTLTIDELGTAALEDVGTAPGNVVQLDGDAKLPAVDGSQLTGVTTGSNKSIATITPATDTDVTLTEEQYSADVLVIETGAWLEARNIIVPNESRSWQVFSNSAYAATVKTAAGTGVTVQPGVTTRLICDATNVIQELTAAGTSYSGELAATDVQAAIDETMSNITLGVNDVINGQFKIAQSGETFVSPVIGAYDLDGWVRTGIGGAVTISRVAGSVAGSYARQSEVTTAVPTLAAGDSEFMEARLLGYDCVKYIGETFTIRAKVKSDVTGIHCITIYNETQSYVHEVNILAANTWQTVVFTVVGGTPSINSSTNSFGFRIRFTQATGTDRQTATTDAWVTGNFFGTAAQVNGLATVGNKFSIEDVSINLGTVALPNVTGFAAELARCQRFRFRIGGYPGAGLTGERTNIGDGFTTSTTATRITLSMPTTMNANPSLIWGGTITVSASGYAGNVTGVTTSELGLSNPGVLFTHAATTANVPRSATIRTDLDENAFIEFRAQL